MDRTIVYPSSIPLDTDILNTQRNAMIGLGTIMNALWGSNTVAVGLLCTPTVPASMQVNVGPGAIVSMQTVDGSSFGSLPSDASPLVKSGVNLGSTVFTLTAPTTTGQSINYLIEATFTETDNTPVVLPYFDAANPSQPYSGPNNSGTAQNTKRAQVVSLQLKASASANTGTQATPAVDAGWVGLYVIQVNFAQTSITNTSISTYPNAPFLAQFLQQHHKGVPGQAPKIDLISEVQNALPLANLPSAGSAMVSNIQTFTSSGTFTVPAGVTKVKATVIAGGGGANGCNSSNFAGACGGGGGWSKKLCTVAPGQTVAVTVGAGGTGAAATAAAGAGGTSSFGSFCSASGGGGAGGNGGGGGGVGANGDINGVGGAGSDGSSVAPSATTFWSGLAGGSLWGGAQRAGTTAGNSSPPGGAGGKGCGGTSVYTTSGSVSAFGSSGVAGVVVVEW